MARKPAAKKEDGLPLEDAAKAPATADENQTPATSADEAAKDAPDAQHPQGEEPPAAEGEPANPEARNEAPDGAEDQEAIASGPAVAFLLKACTLGQPGEVVRVSHAKLAALDLAEGKDWRAATPAEIAIGA
ncbi:MAG: hypothetical protein ACQRW7_11345 [Caulobacterales bacterium]|uniref:hypothetical protein n=1 Tax=Glycocaulis sp. TaxID=1969725 RepID=UPI003F9EF973